MYNIMYYTGSIPDHPNEFNLSHDITISVSYRTHNTCNNYMYYLCCYWCCTNTNIL